MNNPFKLWFIFYPTPCTNGTNSIPSLNFSNWHIELRAANLRFNKPLLGVLHHSPKDHEIDETPSGSQDRKVDER